MRTKTYMDLTGIMVNKRNHPKMALFQVSELLSFAQIYIMFFTSKNQKNIHTYIMRI